MNITVTFPKKNILVENNGGGGTGGTGEGDMLKSVYDPTEVEADAFDMDNMAEGDTNKLVSAAEKSGWNSKAAGDHNHSGVYEPADSAIQSHISSAHAPSTALNNVYTAATAGGFPETGNSSLIYIAIDTGLIYRWNGITYVLIGLVTGEDAKNAYRGDRGKTAYDHSQVAHAPSNAQANADITKEEIEAKLTSEVTSHTHPLKYFTIYVGGLVIGTPAKSTNYYFGNIMRAPVTTAGYNKIYIRHACNLIEVEIYINAGATIGSSENWELLIRKNNTTDYTIATVGVASADRIFTNIAMDVSFSIGDYFEIKMITPNWSSVPTSIGFGGYIIFKIN